MYFSFVFVFGLSFIVFVNRLSSIVFRQSSVVMPDLIGHLNLQIYA